MRYHVSTSNIVWIEYGQSGESLRMMFDTGKCVQYEGIPPGYVAGILYSPSAGSFFNRHIKGVFQYTVISPPDTQNKPVDELTKLRHEYDSSRGLWCIDRDPKDVDISWIREHAFQL